MMTEQRPLEFGWFIPTSGDTTCYGDPDALVPRPRTTCPRRMATAIIATPTAEQMTSATTDASTPKDPPVSQSGPSIDDRTSPGVGASFPDTIPDQTVPCV